MSRLTVVSLNEAQANMDVGHELIVVTYEVVVIVVVGKVHTNKKKSKEWKFLVILVYKTFVKHLCLLTQLVRREYITFQF